MAVLLRREYALHAATSVQVMALLVAWQEGGAYVWRIAVGVVAAAALFAWLFALRRQRSIADTPTSRIASAAQGFVEIVGRGEPYRDAPLVSPFTHLPCLWYRYHVYRRDNENNWVHDHSLESDQFFEIDDGTGRCIVDPAGAEVLSQRKETRQDGDWKHVEYLLLKGDPIYALGQFRTVSGDHQPLSLDRDVGQLLEAWKGDQAGLKTRFDLNGDGEVDQAEWTLARQAARREVERQHREIRNSPMLHYLEKPANGRPFILANHPPEGLGRQYRYWARFQFLALVLAVLALPWAWTR